MVDNLNDVQRESLQLSIRPEVASGVYSNLVLINHSHADFVVDFAQMLPGMPKPDVASRVIMAPEHAKRLLMALQENVRSYEQENGTIDIDARAEGRTLPPFMTGKGEA